MIESLEHRLLMRRGVIGLDGRTVFVNGTAGDDVITLSGGTTRIVVRLNEQTQVFAGQDVRRIIVFAGAGNDRVDAGAVTTSRYRPLYIPARIDGGIGDDTLYSGIKSDTLLGATGDDYLSGEMNHDAGDYHDGGIGDDLMEFGGTMYGGRGNDTATGDNGPDPIVGGVERLQTISDGRGSWEKPFTIDPTDYRGNLSSRKGKLVFRYPTHNGYDVSLSGPTVRADGMLQIVLKARFKSNDYVLPDPVLTATFDIDDAVRRGIVLKYDDANGAFSHLDEQVVLIPSG